MTNISEEKIRFVLIKQGMTIKDLAEKLTQSQPNLSKKLKNNNFSETDLRKIAEATGTKLEINFVLEDGTKI